MTEILTEITAEAKKLLDKDRAGIYREMCRVAIVSIDQADIEIGQYKLVDTREAELVQANGAMSLATPEWFNNVNWLQDIDNARNSRRDLRLDVTYPLEFFDEKPLAGGFRDGRWLEQYGSIDGFGNGGTINTWVLRFADPAIRSVRQLRYPEDPTALEVYNERFRQYLESLDRGNPTISYYRALDLGLESKKDRTSLVLGGLSLVGLGDYEVLHRGSSPEEDLVDSTRIILHSESEQNGYVGRDVMISPEGAYTEPLWDGEDERARASDELLETTLELLRDATR